jgi:hypothetical protein
LTPGGFNDTPPLKQNWFDQPEGSQITGDKAYNGSVRYLLADTATGLGLTESELMLALGDVADELADSLRR